MEILDIDWTEFLHKSPKKRYFYLTAGIFKRHSSPSYPLRKKSSRYQIRGSVSGPATSALNLVESENKLIYVSLIPNKDVKQAGDYFMPGPGLEF